MNLEHCISEIYFLPFFLETEPLEMQYKGTIYNIRRWCFCSKAKLISSPVYENKIYVRVAVLLSYGNLFIVDIYVLHLAT